MQQAQLIRCFRDITETCDPARPMVTLFSGGLDSTYLLYRLRRAGVENVHAVSVDLGDEETVEHKQRIAAALGVRLHVIDGRQLFAEEYVRPAIAAHSVYQDTHPVSSSLSRPLIAKLAMGLAHELDAGVLLHSANRSQNTLRRLNGALRLLGFDGRYGSPYHHDSIPRRQKLRALAELALEASVARPVSCDSNLWCREFESGIVDDPEDHDVPERLYTWTRPGGVGAVESIEVGFKAGCPVSLDGTELPLTALVTQLNQRVGAHGIGRFSGLEHLAGGEKVLEIREMPAAWLLLRSRRHLEAAVLEPETIREKMHQEHLWVREALEGRWFGELRRACQSFIDACVTPVTGTVRWQLRAGTAQTRSIVAAHPAYLRDRDRWESQGDGR